MNYFGKINDCQSLTYVKNSDRTVSIFQGVNPLAPTLQCCSYSGFTFDSDKQKCYWTEPVPCDIENPFKITLNPVGNDGALFFTADNETCTLDIEFKYLFKFTCKALYSILNTQNPTLNTFVTSESNAIYSQLVQDVEYQTTLCTTLTNQKDLIESQILTTPYSISCQPSTTQTSIGTLPPSAVSGFSNTGFGTGLGQVSGITQQPIIPLNNDIYCLTQDGLNIWSNILGPLRYQNFLNGDTSSYTCNDITTLLAIDNTSLAILTNICSTPIGSRTTLENQLLDITTQLSSCQNSLSKLQQQLDDFQETPIQTLCNRPIDMFETLDASLSLDITDSSNVTTSVLQIYDFFSAIGVGNLYEYLTGNTDSGFYVCTNSACDPLQISQNTSNTQGICSTVSDSLIDDLYIQSGLPTGLANTITFYNTLPINSFASNWLTYKLSITDPQIISQLIGNKVSLTLNLNHTCGDICILLDNIKLNKVCTSVDKTNIFVTKCPGFELERIRDNKKSWVSTTTPLNRDFRILDFEGNNAIRQTNYDVIDERLILNTKEIDLDIKMASAIETDIWCYAVDNACILTGETYCGPCGYKQFQDDEYFEFMDNEPYQFMDDVPINNSGGVSSICCGDQIDFNLILTQSLSNTVVLEDFQYIISSELIDAKNRQTISSYATLRALYDRYLNSNTYCGNDSSAFNYMTMEQFSDLVGNYWVDLVEQVIPATTIWGSVRVYSNTIFDQQKFKYRSYSSLFNTNPYDGEEVLSPINGISGQCTTVGVEISTITNVTNPQSIYTSLCLAQMNHGSEFIGQVTVFKTTE
jgi:hypothetical protein